MNDQQVRKLTLASASPRRKELLLGLGLNFTVEPSDVEETIPEGETAPARVVQLLAYQKTKAVAEGVGQGIVLGADTIVVLDGKILGKPQSATDAFSMIKSLQGRAHDVYTGLVMIDVEQKLERVDYQSTKVWMKALSDTEINQYIATGEPFDKAGAYAIQGLGSLFIERIEGDFFTVVGLPLGLTAHLLKEFGVDVLHINGG